MWGKDGGVLAGIGGGGKWFDERWASAIELFLDPQTFCGDHRKDTLDIP